MKSLATRVFLILLAATVVIQVLSFGGVMAFTARDSRAQMFEFMAKDVAFVHHLLRETPVAERERWVSQLDRGFYLPSLAASGAQAVVHPTPELAQAAAILESALDDGFLATPVMVGDPVHGIPAVDIPIDAQQSLRISFPARKPPFSPPSLGVIVLYLMVVTGAVMMVAWGAVRVTTRPLQRLADAAHALGRNLDAPALPTAGPSEVAAASAAFNAMQRAVQRHLSERTQILASVSHDLKTPLTRLRLRLGAYPGDDNRARMEADLDAMNAMIQEGLDYARSAQLSEPRVPVDLQALVESIADGANDVGQDVTVEGRLHHAVVCAPRAMERALQNLVDNAIKYGTRARIRLIDAGASITLRVEDEGPGLKPELLQRVFDPFFRVESSRSRETGGTGLGLAIAQNLLRTQGGDIHLENLATGGLAAVVTLSR